MANLTATRGAQEVLNASFVFNFDDQMVPISGGTAIAGTTRVDFGKTNIVATAFDIINLPLDAVIISGELTVETAFDTASYAVIIGDSASTNRYLSTADRKAAARTALTPTGYRSLGEPLRITITNADVCTTGKATVRIQYVIHNRSTVNNV
jgi:hypothetical protein